MAPTNIVADELERFGVRTFSAMEMAFNTLGLMHPLLFSITQVELSGHGPLVRPCRYHSTDLLTSCLVLTSASNSRPSNLANLCKTLLPYVVSLTSSSMTQLAQRFLKLSHGIRPLKCSHGVHIISTTRPSELLLLWCYGRASRCQDA